MKTNLLTVWAKRAVPALALAGMAMTACDKEPVEKAPVYRAPYEIELGFDAFNLDSIAIPFVQKFARDTACKHIYLTHRTPTSFYGSSSNGITEVRDYLNERIQLAPNKTSGRGEFVFQHGVILPTDSVWFVQNAWTLKLR